ncbi:unnamed protein product [Dibothriocephalus latus]|uniref:Integrase zinc-binding domain-containing protein n=1 Tax=Dibothriocephalus latus TaxID=60516 RepID=A0A3P7LWJ9_DIBLA|nr:unnamed protein product [Dibothriocephalus latus]
MRWLTFFLDLPYLPFNSHRGSTLMLWRWSKNEMAVLATKLSLVSSLRTFPSPPELAPSFVSTPFHRPFVPPLMRRAVFQTLHELSQPGIRASQKLLAESFVWPGMNKDVLPDLPAE